MEKIINKRLSEIDNLENYHEKVNKIVPLIRSMMQIAVIVSMEISKKYTPYEEIDLENFLNRFRMPVEGTAVTILNEIIPLIRTYYDPAFLKGWFEETKHDTSLNKSLFEFVEFRNEISHTTNSDLTIEEDYNNLNSIAKQCIQVFNKILPDSTGIAIKKYDNLLISIPLLHQNNLITIREISVKKDIWKLKGKTVEDNSIPFSVGLPQDNLFVINSHKPFNAFKTIEIHTGIIEDIVEHNIPVRQTDTFEGRHHELDQLKQWYNDEYSLICLIYGDGGFGKTTLLLESLNSLIEGNIVLTKKYPTLICYYTAKKTKWTERGLEYFPDIDPMIDNCVREIIKSQTTLKKEWFETKGRPLLDKAKNFLLDKGYSKEDVLIIIDNTETLATTQSEVDELGNAIRSLSRSLGRVIVTSRRRERIEAYGIQIVGLTESEGVNLLRRLAGELNVKSILQAGEPYLRKMSRNLMNKPLLIEAFVRYVEITGASLENSLNKLIVENNEELLEFLYEDAWLRIDGLQKYVFFVLINLDFDITNKILRKVCQLVGINKTKFEEAIEETYFVNILDYKDSYIIDINEWAKNFFQSKFIQLEKDEQLLIIDFVKNTEEYSKFLNESEINFKNDRVIQAYSSEYAKAARVAFDRGNIQEAIDMYELAIEEQPMNAYLHDRYSWLLLNRTDNFEKALKLSLKAVSLDNYNIDAKVGLALVYYRLGRIKDGDKQIDLVNKKGRTPSFCSLRKGIARFYYANQLPFSQRVDIYNEAINYFKIAENANNPKNDNYDAKIREDINKYREWTLNKLNKLKFDEK